MRNPPEPIEMQLRTLFRNPASDMQRAQALEDQYANWRKETAAVAESYRSWTRAPRDEHWLAYASYLAALDREEHAAGAYQRLVEQVQGR
jgi:hypothetical protein